MKHHNRFTFKRDCVILSLTPEVKIYDKVESKEYTYPSLKDLAEALDLSLYTVRNDIGFLATSYPRTITAEYPSDPVPILRYEDLPAGFVQSKLFLGIFNTYIECYIEGSKLYIEGSNMGVCVPALNIELNITTDDQHKLVNYIGNKDIKTNHNLQDFIKCYGDDSLDNLPSTISFIDGLRTITPNSDLYDKRVMEFIRNNDFIGLGKYITDRGYCIYDNHWLTINLMKMIVIHNGWGDEPLVTIDGDVVTVRTGVEDIKLSLAELHSANRFFVSSDVE